MKEELKVNLLTPLPLPSIELQYDYESSKKKYFRIVSNEIDPLFYELLNNQNIRVQLWLEKQVKNRSSKRYKRSWLHPQDFSNKAPLKLFSNNEYNYGGGDGWGYKGEEIPPYSTTNGIVPTEYEITLDDIYENKISKYIPIVDIFSNILKVKGKQTYPKSNCVLKDISIVGGNRRNSQALRFKLVVNYNHKVLMGMPTTPLNLGIHLNDKVFLENSIESFIRVGYIK